MSVTQLYRYFDEAGTLLYVGISKQWVRRDTEHKQMACWHDAIALVSVARFASREEAMAAERTAIAAEKPTYNRNFNMPEKPEAPSDKPTVTVRLPDELLAFIDRLADRENRSRNWVLVEIVRAAHDKDTAR